MIEKSKEKAKDIGQRLKGELEKLKELIPLGVYLDQADGCGTAGCFGAKLAILYHEDDPGYDFINGADALAERLELYYWVQMQNYLSHWWPNQDARGAFSGDYAAYIGYTHDYKGVWQAWMDCADNMIAGRQLR